LTRPIRGVFNAVNNGITSEKELNEIALEAVTEAGREFFGPFVSETIVGEKIVDLMRNNTSTGRSVWAEQDTLGSKMMKGFGHLAEGVMPTVLPFDIRRGRLKDLPRSMLSATGLADDSYAINTQGVRLDAAGELAEALSGIKTVRPVIKDSLRFRAYEASSQIGSAQTIFNKVAKQRGKVDAQEITDAYLTSNEQRFKALRDLNMAIEDARTLGMSEGDIAKVLKEGNVTEYRKVMAGKFSVGKPSKEIRKEAYRSGENKISNPFDFEAMREVRSEFSNKPLRPKAFEERRQQMAQPPSIMPPPMPGAVPPPSPPPPQSLFNRGIEALRDIELDKLMGS
jgi:tRNA(Ser,Leu) C12 N-acetylase TAN1